MFAVEHDTSFVVAAGLSLAAKMLADALGVLHVFCCPTLSGVRSAAHPPAVGPAPVRKTSSAPARDFG